MKVKFSLMLLGFALSSAVCLSQNVNRFYENGKVGYKNASGQVVVPAQYTAGSEMNGNYAIVIKDNKRGYINEKGEVIVPFLYDDASVFSNGLAHVMKDGKNGFINNRGETVVPFIYDYASDFSNGLARVQKNSLSGFIDINGAEKIAIQYKDAGDFSNSLAPVQLNTGKWGYINAAGNFVLQPKYDQAVSFSNGEALVKKNGKFIFINSTGKKLREIENPEQQEKEAFEHSGRHPNNIDTTNR